MPDKTLNDPPWVVEIDGIKFATPEAVVLLLQAVSEERDELREALRGWLPRLRVIGDHAPKPLSGRAYDIFDEMEELLDA